MNMSFETFPQDPMAAHRRGALAGMVVAAVAGLLLAGCVLASDAVDGQEHGQCYQGAEGNGQRMSGEEIGARDMPTAERKPA